MIPGESTPWAAQPPLETMKFAAEIIAETYARHRSVWKAGEELGVAGQTVHKWLKKLGIETDKNYYSEADKAAIRDYYANTSPEDFDLDALAKSMGREKANVCRVARLLGLTDQSRPHSAASLKACRAAKKDAWKNKPHPRGMAGKKHTPETLAIVSAAAKRSWVTQMTFGIGNGSPENIKKNRERLALLARTRPAEKSYTRAKGGKRPDLGDTHFRSSWEANYARYLNLLIRLGVVTSWEFEPQTFWFDGIKRGVCSYRPDFRVIYKNDLTPEWVELKGWVQAKDRTKWRRMKKYHPTVKLVVIAAKEYYAIQKKWASSIPHWESGKGKWAVAPAPSITEQLLHRIAGANA